MTALMIINRLKKVGTPEKVKVLSGFFKTGKGQYGEGDIFLGVTVPEERTIAKEFRDLSFVEIEKLLTSPYHEARLTGLLILTYAFEKADDGKQKEIYDFLLDHRNAMNNWDLVDVIAPKIVGEYFLHTHPSVHHVVRERRDKQAQELRSESPPASLHQPDSLTAVMAAGKTLRAGGAGKKEKRFDSIRYSREILHRFAKSDDLWERRIAIVSTFAFIRVGQFDETLAICEMLLDDTHDLIHKATGWMLREVGKRDEKSLRTFLDRHASHMPRTMLRYAIERLSERERKEYLETDHSI